MYLNMADVSWSFNVIHHNYGLFFWLLSLIRKESMGFLFLFFHKYVKLPLPGKLNY